MLLLVSVVFASAQDTLLELSTNNTIRAFYNASIGDPNSPYVKKSNNKALLTLPFIDDFSQNYIFPDANLWMDMHAHVNSNFADNPITFGVATLDGLDSTGTPYNFALPTSYGIADYLTSQPINLSSIIDSVFLSFYYQPQGNGNKPETKDSLRLEFFRQSDSSWVRMWGAKGAANQPFQQVMIPVDTSFQNNEFQFRFKNWATLSGNVDHWNIDYVYLDENRNYADTALNDVSFITNHHSMLKDFTAMPWSHYLTDTIGLMDTAMHVTYKNNHSSTYAVFYKYEVIDNNGAGPSIEIYPSTASSKNVAAYSSLTEPQAVYNPPVNNFSFPSDASPTKVFQIKNYFTLTPTDIHTDNDTVLSYQVFGSYYAYDDGSAEVGYGVQGIGSKLAHEFSIKKSDTLKAFQIYFTPILNNLSAETFRLKVWSSLSPEVEIYSQPAAQFTSLEYTWTNQFKNYNLDTPLYLTAGTYYFGWEKISANFLNVGWDVNTNNKTKVHFNAVGIWQTASFDGTLMLRPVFGSVTDPQVSIEEKLTSDDFEIYPNPTSSVIYFKNNSINNDSYHIQLIDIYGKIIIETESSLTNKIDVTNIANGIYIIRFMNNETKKIVLKKVIISK
ncbi:MAG: T9SS type A sorting domain-containing protein [Flavobacteriales bacterium]|nr:T9SS type A sorting domain-containing protein [Flavobacteriales bacterium]